jgi:competence protein ComEC
MAAVRPVSCALWSRGIRRLDAAIVSHADADHYNALPELAERFPIDAVYISPFMFNRSIAALQELKSALAQRKLPLKQLVAGDQLRAHPEVKLEVLHPPRRGVGGNDNARSIVLLIEYAGRRILLPGDLESPGLEDLLAELPIDCDVVMAPHHGSTRSNPRGFAAWSRPDFAVISGPRDPDDARDTAAVKLAYRQAGAKVLHTAEDGAIEFTIDREGYVRCRTFRGGPQKTLAPFIEL